MDLPGIVLLASIVGGLILLWCWIIGPAKR